MRVFISWSGPRSRCIAEAVAQWLPIVIQATEPWLAQDIDKGLRWTPEIAGSLEQSKVGIFCLTPDNLEASWLHFEAGAVSKTKDARVCTLLVDVEPADVKQPLGAFQHTKFDKEDVFKLLQSINAQLPTCEEKALDDARLRTVFDKNWPELEQALNNCKAPAPATPPPPVRTDRDLLEELLDMVRNMQRQLPPAPRGLDVPPAASRNARLIKDDADYARILADFGGIEGLKGLDSLFSTSSERELEDSIGALSRLSNQARKAEIIRHLNEKAAKKGMPPPPADADDQKKD